MSNLEAKNYENFGSANNIGKDLNDAYIFDNVYGYSSIGFRCTVPTGGIVTFEGSFDDANWEPVSMRCVHDDIYTQSTDNGHDFIGSIAAMRKIRWRTSSAGSANGTVIGRAQRDSSTIEGIEFGYPPHRTGFTPVHKDSHYTTAQTGADIWTPSSDKKFVVTDLDIICGGTTDAVVTLFDETNSAGNIIFKGIIDVSNNKQFVFSKTFRTPFISSAANNDLKITTSAGITIDIIIHGYEI